jgi:hypothetical protein
VPAYDEPLKPQKDIRPMSYRIPILRARDQVRSTYQPVRPQEADPAAHQSVDFVCPRGHEFTLMFAENVELPSAWECRQHSTAAGLKNQARPQPPPVKVRTHWDMLRERRKESDLERLLDAQLKALRSGQLMSVEQWLHQRAAG